MSDGLRFPIQIVSGNSSQELDKIGSGVESVKVKVLDFKSALAGIGVFSLALNQISSAVEGIGNSLNKAIAPGVAFDTKMHELKAITNATDEQMKLMEDSA
jgi:hypothetical protein